MGHQNKYIDQWLVVVCAVLGLCARCVLAVCAVLAGTCLCARMGGTLGSAWLLGWAAALLGII